MKNIFGILLLFISLPAMVLADEEEDITSTDGYILVWHDEFDNEGAPNALYWSCEEGFVRNKELQWYQSENAWCRNGILTLTARKENRPNPNYNSKSHDWRKLRKNIYLSSASITTKNKYEFLLGRFETRARISGAPGTWPSIWLKGNKYAWPSCGEVDVLSFYRYHGEPSILANVCWAGNEDTSEWDTSAHPLGRFLENDSLWLSKFHVWRMDWDQQAIRIYVDDQLLNETSLTQTINAPTSKGADDNPFESPLHIMLGLAMGSSGGYVYKETLPTLFEIDYVRVFQKL